MSWRALTAPAVHSRFTHDGLLIKKMEGQMQRWQNALIALGIIVSGVQPLAAQIAAPAQEARAAVEPKCWPDWSEAAVVVRREALAPVERINKLAREKHPGADVIKVTLCEEQGKFTYRLVLREKQGQLKSVQLDARQPEG
jgi:uncharacterized membrane protein YkoI